MTCLRPCFFLLGLLFSFFTGYPQSPSFIHYSVRDGLPSAEVYEVHQDRNGFIWFATDNGVVRFDGFQMETFQVSQGLTDPVVFGFVEDHKGRIWFRTFSGKLSYFFNGKIHPYRYNDSLNKINTAPILQSLYVDAKDNVWFGTEKWLGKISAEGKIEKESVGFFQLYLKEVEDKFVSSMDGSSDMPQRIRLNDHRFQSGLEGRIMSHPAINVLKWNGSLYFSKGTAIFKVTETGVTQVLNSREQIIRLALDSSNTLWVGFLQGGARGYRNFEDTNPLHFPILDSLSVTGIMQDTKGGYWLSTLQSGVYYIPHIDLLHQPIPTQSKIKSVFSRGDEVLIGDNSGFLYRANAAGIITQKTKIAKGSILSIFSDNQHDWISTSGGTQLVDHALNPVRKLPTSFSCLSGDSKGFVWGVCGPIVNKLNSRGDAINTFINESSRLVYPGDKKIYLFGRLGLHIFLTPSFEEVKIPSSFDGLKISKVLDLGGNRTLLATLGSGFYVVNEKDWTYDHYYSKDKFVADNIYAAVLIDSVLWLGTEKGIAVTGTRSLLHQTPTFTFYTKQSGLPSDRITALTLVKPNLWAFYDDGFCLLPPSVTRAPDAPSFYVKNVFINDKPDSLESLISLRYDENNIQINFGFIDFRNENIIMRHRLAPDAPWNYTDERALKYFSLSPGSYAFELEYSLDNLHWASAMKKEFVISPQWWKDWRVQLSVIMAAAIVGFFYYKRRVRILNEKQNLLKIINEHQDKLIRAELDTMERERSRIAKDLHDSVGTNLSAIKLMVRELLKKNNEPKADTVEGDLQSAIQEIKDIIYELRPIGLERYDLTTVVRHHVEKMQPYFNLKIEVNSFGPEIHDPKINLHLFRIVQELLSNSLKHARAKKITIHINSFEDMLNIIYQDDGIGFDTNLVSQGSGLMNLQSRVQILKGNIKFESGDFGTSFAIDIPLKLQ